MTKFRLRFPESDISRWAQDYKVDSTEKEIENAIVPLVRKVGYMDRDSFLYVCNWKTARSRKRCRENDNDFIHEVTQQALCTGNEEMRIKVLTLLRGVAWPTASVILHWFHQDWYPILDFRALESVGIDRKDDAYDYDFTFWQAYTKYCRQLADKKPCHDLAKKAGVSPMRILDRALWQYSKERS